MPCQRKAQLLKSKLRYDTECVIMECHFRMQIPNERTVEDASRLQSTFSTQLSYAIHAR